jgi:glycolate oxidase iron-sulfur subunit
VADWVETRLLDACVHCGLCLAACPTYVELGEEADSPRGRIHLMRGLAAGRLAPTPEVRRHLDLCLGCRACETACPSGVEYGRLIEAARSHVERTRPAPARAVRRLLGAVLGSPALARIALAPAALAGGRRWARVAARRLPLAGLRSWLAYAASAPPRSRLGALPERLEPSGPPRGTAVLLTGCVADVLFPATQHAAARLLARAGVRVVVPRDQGCCGALAAHLGADDRARALAARAGEALDVPGADWIVTTAAGCGAHLRGWTHLLPDDPRAARVAGRTRDALELLDELGLPPAPRRFAHTVAVHDPCHLVHGQGVRAAVRRLLAAAPGLRLVDLEESDTCCGSAGTYNLTERAMARRLADRKLAHVRQSGAEVVAAANPGCLLQIRAGALLGGLDIAVEHPLDLLAAAHGVGADGEP